MSQYVVHNRYEMIAGYIRVSTAKQHPENQMDEIKRYAESNGMDVDKWVVEVVSGKTLVKGRKLGRLLKSMRRGDTLLVTEISRLSRSLTDIMSLMGKCMEKGINIYTTKERYRFDDSINSKVLCFAFGLVAEIERNLISMRTKEALALRRAEGKPLGRKKGSSPKMSLLRDSTDLIQSMYEGGMSDSEIYSMLGVSRATWYKFKKEDV